MAWPTGTVSACTSTTRAREPSEVTVRTLPGMLRLCSSRKARPALPISSMPPSARRKRPSSEAGPKRFLRPRRRRFSPWRSPSRKRTTSTMCSSVRGPAMAPSLVTCPTRRMGTPLSFAHSISRATAARTWEGLPGCPGTSWSWRVCTESTMARGGRRVVIASTHPATVVSPTTTTRSSRQPSRAARRASWPGDSSPAQ